MQYEAPETTKAAVALLAKAKGSAYVLAGGSDLLVRMRGGFVEPDLVVDIKRIKPMRIISIMMRSTPAERQAGLQRQEVYRRRWRVGQGRYIQVPWQL
jgi:hypothetical protein